MGMWRWLPSVVPTLVAGALAMVILPWSMNVQGFVPPPEYASKLFPLGHAWPPYLPCLPVLALFPTIVVWSLLHFVMSQPRQIKYRPSRHLRYPWISDADG